MNNQSKDDKQTKRIRVYSKTYHSISEEINRMPSWKKEVYNDRFATSAHADKLIISSDLAGA